VDFVTGGGLDMGIDSAPNIGALKGSAEAVFRADYGGVFRRGISGKIFLGEIFLGRTLR